MKVENKLLEYQKLVSVYYPDFGYTQNLLFCYVKMVILKIKHTEIKNDVDHLLFVSEFLRLIALYCSRFNFPLTVIYDFDYNEVIENVVKKNKFTPKFEQEILNEILLKKEMTKNEHMYFIKDCVCFCLSPKQYFSSSFVENIITIDTDNILKKYDKNEH